MTKIRELLLLTSKGRGNIRQTDNFWSWHGDKRVKLQGQTDLFLGRLCHLATRS